VRVTIGAPEENDRFLEVFGSGSLLPGLTEYWQLPTGDDAHRVHAWLRRLVDPDLPGRMELAAACELLSRCESATWGTPTDTRAFADVPQVLHAIADLVADAPAEALPRLVVELSRQW
jgi:hypothetical protein